MSGMEDREPASVRQARHNNQEIGQLAAGLVAVADGVHADLAVIADALGVELPDLSDPEAIVWARLRAVAEDRQVAIERTKAQMDQSRAAARRQTGVPRNVRRDGSHVNQQDTVLEAHERNSFLTRNGYGQAAAHAQMAQAPAPSGSGDAHRATRAIREAMYARMAAEEQS